MAGCPPIIASVHRLALLASLAVTGCLVPAPLEEEPPEVNLPPFYDPAQVQPSFRQIFPYNPQIHGRILTLSVSGIGDPNPSDHIFWRAFVNYDPRFSSGIWAAGDDQPGATRAEIILSPCNLVQTDAILPVELIVADRPFLNSDEEPEPAETPNRYLPEDARRFHIVWFIQVDRSLCAE